MATYRNPQTGEVLTEEQFKKRFGTTPLSSAPKQVKESSKPLEQRVGTSLEKTGSRILGNIEGTGEYAGQSPVRRGVDATAAGLTGALDVGFQTLPQPVREGVEFVGEKVGEGFNWLTDQISNNKALQDWAYKNPEAVKGLNEILGTAASAGEVAGDILIFGGGVKATKPVVGGAADTLKGAGEAMYKSTIVPEESTRMALQSYQAAQPTLIGRVKNMISGEKPTAKKPITEAETAARYGLAGTEWMLGVQAKKVSGKLWDDIIEPALDEVRGNVNMSDFFSQVRSDILSKTKEPSLRNARLDALDDLKADYSKNPRATLKELQGFKEGWAEKVPESAYKGRVPGSAINYVRDTAASKARSVIYKYAGTKAQQAYIDYGNLQSIMKAGVKSIGDPAKKSFGRNTWEFLMDQAITPIATIGGKVLYRTGQGLEFIGNRGARKVGDIVGPSDIPTRIPVRDMGSDFISEADLPTIRSGRTPRQSSELPVIE